MFGYVGAAEIGLKHIFLVFGEGSTIFFVIVRPSKTKVQPQFLISYLNLFFMIPLNSPPTTTKKHTNPEKITVENIPQTTLIQISNLTQTPALLRSLQLLSVHFSSLFSKSLLLAPILLL